ncbi:PadR family transcriptional regulator [Dubosiella newyorkensis]|jgi:DNA-binding PadR family transcriptional regulator|uniref:PadR family transcriptional regulator n=2 Tax=Dubosiella newyorkensis TaxID=1862672 RepID=A0A1U7NK28_9FIRM|nr:helix-turn-helix transcriptional regulator [Dubosiella newyorkensis]MCI9040959.1 PadR family transcriptional regulator [Dubosiella newyorkensis]OLU44359.1 PadR family transcriptional regulator [Dubosiella newyorkensis]
MGNEPQQPLTESIFYILLALHTPNHGYGIIKEVETLTNGRVIMGAGTLYGAIKTLLKKKWIRLYADTNDSRNKKEYVITPLGKEIFSAEVNRLEELVANAKKKEKEHEEV